MGQSLLIDMNSGWYKHKTELNEGLRTDNYLQCKRALDALNALLPEDYRVIIDTEEYNQKVRQNLVALCGFCKSEYDDPNEKGKKIMLPTRQDVYSMEKLHILLSPMDQMILGKEYENVWVCQKCNTHNKISKTKYKQSILRKPFYLQVVPEAPILKSGIENRRDYHSRFEQWATGFLVELNAQARQFRHDYKGKDEIDDMGTGSEMLMDDEL